MKEQIKHFNFEKISSRLSKTFGSIKKGHEQEFEFILFTMESNLIKANRRYRINNGRRLIEAIRICLFTIDGYLKGIEYDFENYLSDANRHFVDALLMSFDPFTNPDVKVLFEQDYNPSSTEDLTTYFTAPIKCLIRLEKSVELWSAEGGINGYFSFLENVMGRNIQNDNKMDFVYATDHIND